ncbi:CHAT domain-containing protein [Kitasatospora sp. NPDC017646]|uniref:CHAT domain-containing protein n=1 Tax=Kitasatospora sp. NPDC017646 TaxID=3364024 RepID=UPI00379C4FF4
MPDEVLTLASAFHHAGYRHVVGTLWDVRDDVANQLAKDVYPRLLGCGAADGRRLDGSCCAQALHDAVRGLQVDHPYTPSAWASFIHIGP